MHVKSQIFVIRDNYAGRGVRVAESWIRSVRHGDDFDWLGGHSANQEALEVNLRGSYGCNPFSLTC